MMEFYKKFGAAKGGGGSWTQSMHPLYTSSNVEDPLSKSPLQDPQMKTPLTSLGPAPPQI
jgi:hypothetical protein